MSCHLQKLFVTDGELEDEDFLSAVEDAENQFVTPGHPSGSVVPVLPIALHPSNSHPGNSHPSNSHPSTPHPIKPPTLRPLAGQGDHPMGFPSRGSAARDEQDNSLFPAACRDMEGPEVSMGVLVPPGYPQKPPRKCPGKENAQEGAVPKKIRVGEELIPGSGGLQDRQSPLPSPKLVLRPSTAGACAPRDPPDMGGSRGSVPAPGAPCLRPVQTSQTGSSPSVSWTPPAQNCPRQPPRPSSGPPSSVDPPRQPPRPSSGPPRPSSGPPSSVDPPRQPLRPSSGPPRPSSGPPSSVDPPRQPPRFPNAPGPPNPPVVTNHLVQLVTAASKAPRGAPRAPQGRESRRFPGPAGILPQQHSGKLLEEILVSAPQSPAHGAVAKPRAQALPSSPLPTEEDFGRGPWLAMKRELGLDERDPSCFLHTYSVVMVLRKAALKQLPKNKVPSMAVMIKTLSRSSAGAGAVFRDPTGEGGQFPCPRGAPAGPSGAHRSRPCPRGDAGHGAQAAAGAEAERAPGRGRAAPEAGRGLLPLPPKPLPQRDPQQPPAHLPPRARGLQPPPGPCPG